MSTRNIHVVHLLVRDWRNSEVTFLLYPHNGWHDNQGNPYLSLPTEKTVNDPLAPFIQGTSLEQYVKGIAIKILGLRGSEYALEQEIEPVMVPNLLSPAKSVVTDYTIYPVDLWVEPSERQAMSERVNGYWLNCMDAVTHPQISPTSREVLQFVLKREIELEKLDAITPDHESKPEAPSRLLRNVPSMPTMVALAKRWLEQNRGGVRYLAKQTLDEILEAGDRAFNLRVADPYLRYQMQGIGFTWSFFTHKDPQDIHVHGAPVVEIYGILEGELEIWWKHYHDRGTSAWSHRVLGPGDWIEVDSLQCHIVNWLGYGKGVVFKGGPGPLAGVGRLGVQGKTPCRDCPCMKTAAVASLEAKWSK